MSLLGLKGYSDTAPFDETMLVHFRKRISADMLARINERIVENQLKAEAAEPKQAPKQQSSETDDDQDSPFPNAVTSSAVEEKEDEPDYILAFLDEGTYDVVVAQYGEGDIEVVYVSDEEIEVEAGESTEYDDIELDLED